MFSLLVEIIKDGFITLTLFYMMSVLIYYNWMVIQAYLELKKYRRSHDYVYYDKILSSPLSPGISIIAPAYNEELNIVSNVRSLLSLYYNKYEVIVVNDGSKDQTLQKLIDEFDLKKVDFYYDEKLKAQAIKGIYRSQNNLYYRLTVVDKVNGGKADALNAGINVTKFELTSTIDVDCILDNNVLVKLVKPFLNRGKKVIAVGGTVQVANDSVIKNGRLLEFRMPKSLIAGFQAVEYARAFIIGRLSWSRANALILISGALGLFDKKTLINAGGYLHETVGEDIELIVRMRKYMKSIGEDCRVVYVPETLCWTEVPEDASVLIRQRNRWTRGAIDTLLKHKDLLLNPRYGALGLFAIPYWFLIEWFSPLIQVLGYLGVLFIILFHTMDYHILVLITLISLTFYWSLSIIAVIFEEMTNKNTIATGITKKLLFLIFIEPFVYHPITIYAAVRGNIDYFRGKTQWGDMKRKGLK